MKQVFCLFILCISHLASACNWNNVNVGYSDSCNKFTFEVSGTVDTCFKIEAKIYLGTTLKATYNHRVFSHYFQDTGQYVVRFKVLNTCTNCDTIIYKPIYNGCNTSSAGCNWSKANISYSQNCNKFTFEMGSIDTCFTYKTLAIRNSTIDTISSSRVFTHTFSDTGTYIIRTTFHNKCNGCDTVIYKEVRITCLTHTSCNWSKANISFSKNCNKLTFEMGSKDTCFTYKTLAVRNGHVDTISNDRVFTHTFSDTGTYIIRTTFHNKCNGCDTVIYKEARVECLTAGVYYIGSFSPYITIFPNPAATSVKIMINDQTDVGPVNVSVHSLLGQLLINQKINQEDTELDVSQLPEDIYILKVSSNTHTYNYKIIVSR